VEGILTQAREGSVTAESPETEEGRADHREKKEPKKGKKEERNKESLREQLKAAEAKAEENYDRLMRVTADFENYKKRMDREMNDFRKFANESLVKEILPIVDNLERALAAQDENDQGGTEGLRQGVEMTLKGLLDTLKKFGVVAVDAVEKPFDPKFHQAVSQEETDKYPENTVCHELQKGYMLHDRLLRPAMVVVSKRPQAANVKVRVS
jgi:molecular chaperone GrpE